MEVAAGIAAAPAARLAYVTPSSQYPMGVVLSMARRLELLAWARRAGAFLLEDDYDSEFRYAGRPLASLQGIDDAGRVIYVGTFSKVLFPGLRLGYAVLPPALLEPVRAARLLVDWHPAGLAEGVVTDFLAEGHFAQHLRRMRLRYRAARDALVAALAEHAPMLAVEPPEQGLKLLARLPAGMDDVALAAAAARRGVVARPVSPMFLAAPPVQRADAGLLGPRARRAALGGAGVGRGAGGRQRSAFIAERRSAVAFLLAQSVTPVRDRPRTCGSGLVAQGAEPQPRISFRALACTRRCAGAIAASITAGTMCPASIAWPAAMAPAAKALCFSIA